MLDGPALAERSRTLSQVKLWHHQPQLSLERSRANVSYLRLTLVKTAHDGYKHDIMLTAEAKANRHVLSCDWIVLFRGGLRHVD